MKKEPIQDGVPLHAPEEECYVPPKDKSGSGTSGLVHGALKLGLMMHWAPGCQLGTLDPGPLSDGDGSWSQADVDWTDIETFSRAVYQRHRTFNPAPLPPGQMAELAEECGFKYLLFTTKHHDGFCMFDTQTTDYKITDPSCPFHTSPYADITRSLYDEFRKRGMAISVYFSKPDWHSDDYWHREFGTAPTRNVNYSIEEHPKCGNASYPIPTGRSKSWEPATAK